MRFREKMKRITAPASLNPLDPHVPVGYRTGCESLSIQAMLTDPYAEYLHQLYTLEDGGTIAERIRSNTEWLSRAAVNARSRALPLFLMYHHEVCRGYGSCTQGDLLLFSDGTPVYARGPKSTRGDQWEPFGLSIVGLMALMRLGALLADAPGDISIHPLYAEVEPMTLNERALAYRTDVAAWMRTIIELRDKKVTRETIIEMVSPATTALWEETLALLELGDRIAAEWGTVETQRNARVQASTSAFDDMAEIEVRSATRKLTDEAMAEISDIASRRRAQ